MLRIFLLVSICFAGFLVFLCSTPASPPTAPAAPTTAESAPKQHKLLFAIARTKAVGEIAKARKISRADARELVDQIDDATLAQAAAAAKLTFKDLPEAGGLEGLLQWLVDHQDLVLALVKLIVAILSVIAVDVANPESFAAHDWSGQLFALAA